jgi:deoxycytidylate deaminase
MVIELSPYGAVVASRSSKRREAKPVRPARAHKRVVPLLPIPGVELFFGLVSPSGSRVELVVDALAKHLKGVGYNTIEIHISELIDSATGNQAKKLTFDKRVDRLMTMGTSLRQKYDAPDICARWAIGAVRQLRQEKNLSEKKRLEKPENQALEKTAYVFRSLKTTEEVETLRIIYGQAFNLISIYSSEQSRRENLAKRIASSKNDTDFQKFESEAQRLIYRDSEEQEQHGQDVKGTFPLADLFVSLDSSDPNSLDSAIGRFIRLTFGDPFVTPSKDEYGMFLAKAVALRSSDLGRQVGATITTAEGDLIAAGCNEVPKFGGGQYWEGDDPDSRDFQLGTDASVEHRTGAIAELISRFSEVGWLSDKARQKNPQQLALKMLDGNVREKFAGTQILGILEYGRSVHAEMAAITDAAKRGVEIRGSTLYSTTFPCHLCARHIVSAGLHRVVYIEPYAKSKAQDLYRDSIAVNPASPPTGKVVFEPFVGLSPNRYLYFFQPNSERKDKKGRALVWESQEGKSSRLKRYVASYILMEESAVIDLDQLYG